MTQQFNIIPMFSISSTDQPLCILPKFHRDHRGYLSEVFRKDAFQEIGITEIVQENISVSAFNVVRGLHFQKKPKEVGKLVSCVRGTIFDVAVDIRKESPTYKQYAYTTLSSTDMSMLWIPPGFAHGFKVISPKGATILYRMTEYYSPDHDAGIRWDDPSIGIQWPGDSAMVISEKDRNLPTLEEYYVSYEK